MLPEARAWCLTVDSGKLLTPFGPLPNLRLESSPQSYMPHPVHDQQVVRLKKIEGQVRGLQKMIEERRYCMDLISQIRAVSGALKQVELGILETHLQHCVHDALSVKDASEAETKIQEIIQLIQKT